MMKTNTKAIFSIGVVVAVAFTASPVFAFWAADAKTHAEDAQKRIEDRQAALAQKVEDHQSALSQKREVAKSKLQEQFCTRFVNMAEQHRNNLENRWQNFADRKGNRLDTREAGRQVRDTKLDGERQTRSTYRDGWYAKLLTLAGNDSDKVTAVNEFKTTMESLVADRQKAVDDAIEAFRTGVDAAVNGKQSGAETAAQVFKDAYESALTDAKSACEDGTDPATVRSDFMSTVKVARDTLQESRKQLSTTGEQVKALAETKNTAIKSAMNVFKTRAGEAIAKLKTALGTMSSVSGN